MIIINGNDAFWQKEPEAVIEWQDPKSDAKGILVINEMINGACGGGTRVSLSTHRDELVHLAKIMQLKFSVYGPAIGGAKSGIVMDPQDPNKYAVLKRWFEYIKPILKSSYGTAADLNTDFHHIQSILQSLDIPHPQYAIIQSMYKDPQQINRAIENMKMLDHKIQLDGGAEVRLAQMVTGYLIAELTKNSFDKKKQSIEGKSVIVQGVGTVGGAAAYYLHQMGAKIIGLVDAYAAVIDKNGFSNESLVDLLKTFSIRNTFTKTVDHYSFYEAIKNYKISIFIPAAGSYLVNDAVADLLIQQQCELVVSGSNIPFENDTVQEKLLKHMQIIPSYISSGGMACALSVLLHDDATIQSPMDVLSAIKRRASGF